MYRAGTFRHSLHSHNNYTHILKNVNNFGGFCAEFTPRKSLLKIFLLFSKKSELLSKKSVYIGEGAIHAGSCLTSRNIHAIMQTVRNAAYHGR
jgi:hypothetical protein